MIYTPADIQYDPEIISRILSDYSFKISQAVRPKDVLKIATILKVRAPVISILYFQLSPNFVGAIHKDIDMDQPHVNPSFALNLPLYNCEQTDMHWFEESEDAIPNVMPGITNSARTPLLDYKYGTKVATASMSVPHFVGINTWHSVDNRNSHMSAFISVRFRVQADQNSVL